MVPKFDLFRLGRGPVAYLILLLVGLSLHAQPVYAQDEPPPWRQSLTCEPSLQQYRGLEYCTGLDNKAHVIVIDLSDPDIRVKYVIAEGLDRNGLPGPCQDVNIPTWSDGLGCYDPANDQYYPIFSLYNAIKRYPDSAAILNADYGAYSIGDPKTNRGHGPEGLTVIDGKRIDGPAQGDSDNNAVNRPWIAFGETPFKVEIGQLSKEGPLPEWIKSAAGGAPWLIRNGMVDDEVLSCKNAKPHSCSSTIGQTAAGVSSDGRWLFFVAVNGLDAKSTAEFMLTELGVERGIKFDGGGSTQLYYAGLPGDQPDNDMITRGDGRWLSNYLAILAEKGSGIDLSSPVEPIPLPAPVSTQATAIPTPDNQPDPGWDISVWLEKISDTINGWFNPGIDGFGIGNNTHLAVGTEENNLQNALNEQRQLGVHWSREQIFWEEVETSADHFRWQYGFTDGFTHKSVSRDFDLMVNEYTSREIRILAVLGYGPGYAEKPVPEDVLLDRWQSYVKQIVDRYGDYIDYWEIGNEMNSREFWGKVIYPDGTPHLQEPDPALYSKMLIAAHDIIKKHNRKDVVVLGGLIPVTDGTCSTNMYHYLKRIKDSGAWYAFDAIAIHPYWGEAAPEAYIDRGIAHSNETGDCLVDQRENTNMLGEVRSVIELANKFGAKPVWVTEIGWGSDWLGSLAGWRGTSPDQVEADYLTRVYVPLLSERGVKNIFWFTQYSSTAGPDFSLGKKGQNALHNLAVLLTGAKSLGQYQGQQDKGGSKDDDVHEYRFLNSENLVVIAWKSRGGDVPRDIELAGLPGTEAHLYYADSASDFDGGTTIPVQNGKITLPLTERPVILLLPKQNWFERQIQKIEDLVTDWWNKRIDDFNRLWEKMLTDLLNWFEQWLQAQIQKWLQDVSQQCCGAALLPLLIIGITAYHRFRNGLL